MSFLKISWRHAFLSLASFVVVSLVIWPILWRFDQTHLERLGAEWTTLFELCRTSVELDVPLVTADQQSNALRKVISETAADERTSVLISHGGRFAAREETSGVAADYRRSCSVELVDENVLLDKDEIAMLLSAFVDLREQLTATGKHEFRDIVPLPSITMLSFGLRDGNAAGCSSIAYITVELATRHYNATVAEQTTSACSER